MGDYSKQSYEIADMAKKIEHGAVVILSSGKCVVFDKIVSNNMFYKEKHLCELYVVDLTEDCIVEYINPMHLSFKYVSYQNKSLLSKIVAIFKERK